MRTASVRWFLADPRRAARVAFVGLAALVVQKVCRANTSKVIDTTDDDKIT